MRTQRYDAEVVTAGRNNCARHRARNSWRRQSDAVPLQVEVGGTGMIWLRAVHPLEGRSVRHSLNVNGRMFCTDALEILSVHPALQVME